MVVVPDRPSSSGAGTVRVNLNELPRSIVSVPRKTDGLLNCKAVRAVVSAGAANAVLPVKDTA